MCLYRSGLVLGRHRAEKRFSTAPTWRDDTRLPYYVRLPHPAWGEIPTPLPAGDQTSTPRLLPENQVRLLNALARPILVADEIGRPLYQTPALRQCLAHAPDQERIQLQRALDHAVTRLCSRLRNQTGATRGTRPVVLSRQVLTNRSEFRLRGVLVPRAVLLHRRGILLELERTGKRQVGIEDLRGQFRLTVREVEVATLVAQGLSDQAIAARLGVSLRTAEHHTEHVLRKLRVERRSAVAALLARSSLLT